MTRFVAASLAFVFSAAFCAQPTKFLVPLDPPPLFLTKSLHEAAVSVFFGFAALDEFAVP